MFDIRHYIRIKAPPRDVYRAITAADGVRNWWTRDTRLDDNIGGDGEFRFYDGRVATKVRIEELTPNARVRWFVISSSSPSGWERTTIEFDLKEDQGDTILRFAHCGYAEANDGYAIVTTGWGFYLMSLRQYLQTGRGTPHPEVEFTRVVMKQDEAHG